MPQGLILTTLLAILGALAAALSAVLWYYWREMARSLTQLHACIDQRFAEETERRQELLGRLVAIEVRAAGLQEWLGRIDANITHQGERWVSIDRKLTKLDSLTKLE